MILSRECLLSRLKFWFTNTQKALWQKALSCHSPCRHRSYWETLRVSCQGSEGEKPPLVWSTLWGSLEDCRMRTSANTRVLVTLSCPILSLLLFVLVKRVEFLTKADVTELWEFCVHFPSIFFHSPLNAMKICFLYFLGNTTKSSIHQVWGRDYLHRVTEMLPPVYIAQLVLFSKCLLKVLKRRIAGKSEVAFHILLIHGGEMRHTMLIGKN